MGGRGSSLTLIDTEHPSHEISPTNSALCSLRKSINSMCLVHREHGTCYQWDRNTVSHKHGNLSGIGSNPADVTGRLPRSLRLRL